MIEDFILFINIGKDRVPTEVDIDNQYLKNTSKDLEEKNIMDYDSFKEKKL